jgi:hypothetical protein
MSNVKAVDSTKKELPCRGELKIKVIDRKGKEVYTYDTPNTIVFDAREIMAQLLSGDDASNKKVSKLAVGLDGTPPERADIALANELLKVDVIGYTFPEVGHVEYTAVLDYTSAANGQTFQEAALYTNDETKMFARQIFGQITKTDLFQLQFIWRIIFT